MRGPPLWPAGHLPLKGGDPMSRRPSPIADVERGAPASKLPISPLEGGDARQGREGGLAPPSVLNPKPACSRRRRRGNCLPGSRLSSFRPGP
ncbi:hypothetical protein FJ988_13675 [Mesorhizobium sp. CU3]|nr:hypothetical protein FJ988_13675 [Mesorhizobium sp. CU3]